MVSKNELTSRVAHHDIDETSQAPGKVREETHGNASKRKMYSVTREEKRA